MVNQQTIRLVQKILNKRFKTNLTIDGIYGERTEVELLKIPVIPAIWKPDRKVVGFIQYYCLLNHIESGPIDGYWGPQTDFAYDELVDMIYGNSEKNWRDEYNTSSIQYPTYDGIREFYGEPGQNQVRIKVPYPLRISWKPSQTITSFMCHKKVAETAQAALEAVQVVYGDRISHLGLDLFGGCLNVRKMRGGSKWSTHSWGIAIDWNPSHNRLRWKKNRALFAKPVYDEWNGIWEQYGWQSLGKTKGFDYMHYQALSG